MVYKAGPKSVKGTFAAICGREKTKFVCTLATTPVSRESLFKIWFRNHGVLKRCFKQGFATIFFLLKIVVAEPHPKQQFATKWCGRESTHGFFFASTNGRESNSLLILARLRYKDRIS